MTKEDVPEEKKERPQMTIDLNEVYKFKPEDIEIEIENETYSNLAYIQVAHRDLHIDFLKMPGIKKDDKQKVQGNRVYMSHAAAQKLANKLLEILDKSYNEKSFEVYDD